MEVVSQAISVGMICQPQFQAAVEWYVCTASVMCNIEGAVQLSSQSAKAQEDGNDKA